MSRRQPHTLAAFLLALAAVGLAAQPQREGATTAKTKAKRQKPPSPVHVWGERIHYERDNNKAIVESSKTLQATIIKKDLRIDADHVEGYLDDEQQFKRVVATGNVHIYTVVPIGVHTLRRPPLKLAPNPRRANAHLADYDLKTNIVVLTGSDETQPVVWIDKDEVHADKIIFEQNKNLTLFKGNVRLSALTVKSDSGTPGLKLPGIKPPTQPKAPSAKPKAPPPTPKTAPPK